MARDDDKLRRLFDGIRFADEPRLPPGTDSVEDDLSRARRGLRKRRLATWGSAAVSTAVIASGVAVAVPHLDVGDDGGLPVAEGDATGESDGSETGEPSDQTNPDPAAAEINPCPSGAPPESEDVPSGLMGFEKTRQCLLETAVKHFDPGWEHLPEQTTNSPSGGTANGLHVGTKLGWSVPGEDGLGMVQVAVTTPGYADEEYALASMPGMMICSTSPQACRTEPVPGTDDEVTVVEDDPEYGWLLAVAFERPDGSLASVAVSDLFGNNSLVPVSDVDITLEQAMEFVTDPALKVDEAEAEQSQEEMVGNIEAQGPESSDYSSDEVVPAPEIREMSGDEARAALEVCTDGVAAWGEFEAEFGVWMTTSSGEQEPLVIAQRGDRKMECREGGASLFGTQEVKGSPYLRGPVSYSNYQFGRYVSDVDQVTVQPSGGPAYEAVMLNGYWFLPESLGLGDAPAAIRGYDAAGEPVYDSVDEDRDQCYTDPDGNEIVFHNGEEAPATEDCKPALEWDHS